MTDSDDRFEAALGQLRFCPVDELAKHLKMFGSNLASGSMPEHLERAMRQVDAERASETRAHLKEMETIRREPANSYHGLYLMQEEARVVVERRAMSLDAWCEAGCHRVSARQQAERNFQALTSAADSPWLPEHGEAVAAVARLKAESAVARAAEQKRQEDIAAGNIDIGNVEDLPVRDSVRVQDGAYGTLNWTDEVIAAKKKEWESRRPPMDVFVKPERLLVAATPVKRKRSE
jgi:hypothetical protein